MSTRPVTHPGAGKLLLIGLCSYLLFAIAQTPASVLRDLLPADSGVQLSGLRGTLWNGSAASLSVAQHRLQSLQWSINGWALLGARLSAQLSADWVVNGQRQPLSSNLDLSVLGTLTLRDTRATLDAASLAQTAQIPLAQLGGQVTITLDELEIRADTVPSASGMISWREATVSVAETVSLGEVSIELKPSQQPPLLAEISNRGGELQLRGEASVQDSGDYQLRLNMKPLPGSSDNVRGSLKMFARPLNDGSFQLDNQGNLAQLGLM